jgi:hypothetical protein
MVKMLFAKPRVCKQTASAQLGIYALAFLRPPKALEGGNFLQVLDPAFGFGCLPSRSRKRGPSAFLASTAKADCWALRRASEFFANFTALACALAHASLHGFVISAWMSGVETFEWHATHLSQHVRRLAALSGMG